MATPNPNPSTTTQQMWDFWLAFKAFEPSVLLGGIYANKPGYHNTRNNLPASDYSVREFAADREGPADKAAAIDLTFPNAQHGDYSTIEKYSQRLYNSGKDAHDERGNYLREFFGQTDTDGTVEGWDFQKVGNSTSADTSHLWHIHLSFIRKYVTDPAAFGAVLSILTGESVETWRAKGKPSVPSTDHPTQPSTGDPVSGGGMALPILVWCDEGDGNGNKLFACAGGFRWWVHDSWGLELAYASLGLPWTANSAAAIQLGTNVGRLASLGPVDVSNGLPASPASGVPVEIAPVLAELATLRAEVASLRGALAAASRASADAIGVAQ